ncbi:uncharacterized protein [Panulirus ornatus]|uniref:uncharacterized protein n=1 Tax=Panulirus ornatus TaxID=150431 RepID=UPI003A89DAC2
MLPGYLIGALADRNRRRILLVFSVPTQFCPTLRMILPATRREASVTRPRTRRHGQKGPNPLSFLKIRPGKKQMFRSSECGRSHGGGRVMYGVAGGAKVSSSPQCPLLVYLQVGGSRARRVPSSRRLSPPPLAGHSSVLRDGPPNIQWMPTFDRETESPPMYIDSKT